MRRLLLHLCIILAAALPALAADTPDAAYFAYRAAFDKASGIDDLIPLLCKERAEQMQKLSAEDKAMAFAAMQMFAVKDVKLIKNVVKGDKAIVYVSGKTANPFKDGALEDDWGKVEMVRENGAWKLFKESWGKDNKPPS